LRKPGNPQHASLRTLGHGLQPNTLVSDSAITLPPINAGCDYWSPKNYDGGGEITQRLYGGARLAH
jgi:membrane carboxypeptidase/penicillin-binding protein